MRDRPFPFARRGDTIAAVTDAAFTAAVERHRRPLHRHCARIVGAWDADDALQEALLRAWRARDANRGPLRPWLYRIATNVCCDALARRRAVEPLDEGAAAPREQQPESVVLAKEGAELALLTALRRLPERQHAALLMRDVLHCSARETAATMSLSLAAANSALQRGRHGLRGHLASDRLDWASARPTARERPLLDGLLAACA
jgi:RNA polymerase sigma factor (sigma-70 family)